VLTDSRNQYLGLVYSCDKKVFIIIHIDKYQYFHDGDFF